MGLFLASVLCILWPLAPFAQSSSPRPSQHVYSGTVSGPDQRPVAGANLQIAIGNRTVRAITGADGGFRVVTSYDGPAVVKILLSGFAPFQQTVMPDYPAQLTLALATNMQRVVVTASRTPLALDASANAVQVLSGNALQKSATITLGDRLRQVTGLDLYRRSSTLVANPTSQGVSLRGLGSTAASRSLVLANGIPINDPFGSWIYWDQIPTLAIQDVEVVSGGVSDLYGSSAVGGAINIIERRPTNNAFALDGGYAQENTPHLFALGTTAGGPWSGLAAGDFLRTDGYIEVAPAVRGPIDTAANVHYQNGELFGRRAFAERGSAYLRGDVLNEARGNGTPLQTNGTRLWRYASGVDWTTENAGIFSVALFGSQEHYRQSFSAVPADQASETLTRLQHVAVQQLGGAAQWTKTVLPWLTILAGENVDDIRATDYEIPIAHNLPNGLADTSARQRDIGEYAEALVQSKNWTLSGSLRLDNFSNLDTTQYMQSGHAPIVMTRIPNRSETLFNPKLGAVRRINDYFSLTASAYRAFRAPTMNELYRESQVGQELTLPNADLQSERATGWETGTELALPGHNATVRGSYFWTEVNRPVNALTISVTPSEIVERRQNLGQIRSRGVALLYQADLLPWLNVTGGYQYANATVTQFAQEPNLIGTWIPEVPHNSATMQVRAAKRKLGAVALLGTLSGRQFDSDGNTFLLHGYFQLDAYVSHAFGPRVEAYAAIANALDRSIEVGRTPILTLGTPRMASFGVRIHSRDAAAR